MGRPMRLVLLAAFAAGAIVIAVAGYAGYWFIAAGEIGDRSTSGPKSSAPKGSRSSPWEPRWQASPPASR